MDFPLIRMRRLRRTESMRALVRETPLDPGDLIYSALHLSRRGRAQRRSASMPGVFNLSVDQAVREAEAASARDWRIVALRSARHQR